MPIAERSIPKSYDLLNSFMTYCWSHPEERFWQALRNWCGWSFVLVTQSLEDSPFPRFDTFYWEENRKP